MNRKPRADSKLKTLPPDRQAAIADYSADHTLVETVKWLKDDGLATSQAALSEFLSWWALQRQLERNETTVETLLQKLQVARPDWTPQQMQEVGQAFFSALALEQQNPKVWFLLQTIQLKKQQAESEDRKAEEAKKDDQAKALERCLDESKQWPEVADLFKQAFAALKKAKAR